MYNLVPSVGAQAPALAAGARPQRLVLCLDGITAADYLAWIRDPEPAALGSMLREIAVRAEPLGSRVELELTWETGPPPPHAAAELAGFPAAGLAAVATPGGRPVRVRASPSWI